MKKHVEVILFAALFVSGCGSSNTDVNPVDTGTDGAGDATTDSTTNDADASTDAHADAHADGDADADAHAETDAPSAACLGTSGTDGFDAYFTLMDSKKCVVAQYDVPTAPVMTLTWGRHGGPLGFDASDPANPKIVRWHAPASSVGMLTETDEAHAVTKLPSGLFFWGSQALDLPIFGWTAISYTTTASASAGELLLVTSPSGDAVNRYDVNGYFSETAVGTSDGRLFYTGLSEISNGPTATNAGGLYFADSCGTASSRPRLTPEGDSTCTAPGIFATWQAGTSGPVAIDGNDNLFAILSTYGGDQELRGIHHAYAGRGAATNSGTPMFTSTGFTGEMAADGKSVYFQPSDAATFAALDVKSVGYAVDDTAKTVSPSGASTTFLALKKAGTSVALLVDEAKRLWVGVAKATTGDAGPTSSVFFVLGDKP